MEETVVETASGATARHAQIVALVRQRGFVTIEKRPQTSFLPATSHDGVWKAPRRDGEGARQFEIQARALVNATGQWVDDVLRQVQDLPQGGTQVRLVKGSHVLVRKLHEGVHACTLQQPDGRVVFAIPSKGDYTVVVATDVSFACDPHCAGISPEEKVECLKAHEWAGSADDIIWRRTKLGLHRSVQERTAFGQSLKAMPCTQSGAA